MGVGIGTAAVIDVEDLHMRYGAEDVLRGVTFRANRGEVVALLGPNGAGKSTTIEILEGFRARSGGRVTVLGQDPALGDQRWRSRMGIVLQSWRDHGKWRVRELLAHLGSYYVPYGTAATPRPWDADELLATVDLTRHAGKRIRTLSGGQRRRLDVAIGLVGRPELLVLDEPTTGLDPAARHEFHDLVRRLCDQERCTVLLATHDLDEAATLADRLLVLADGTIIADGTAGDLAGRIPRRDRVSWDEDGRRQSRVTSDSTGFVRRLLAECGDSVGELEVRRTSLEDVYLTLIGHADPEPTGITAGDTTTATEAVR